MTTNPQDPTYTNQHGIYRMNPAAAMEIYNRLDALKAEDNRLDALRQAAHGKEKAAFTARMRKVHEAIDEVSFHLVGLPPRPVDPEYQIQRTLDHLKGFQLDFEEAQVKFLADVKENPEYALRYSGEEIINRQYKYIETFRLLRAWYALPVAEHTAQNLYDLIKERVDELEGELLSGTDWNGRSTNAWSNITDQAKWAARQQLRRNLLDWVLRRLEDALPGIAVAEWLRDNSPESWKK